MSKPNAIRRSLRNLDASERFTADELTLVQLELARAYDAGHIDGSGVKHQTDAETELAIAVRELTLYQVMAIGEHVSPELATLMEDVREPEPATSPSFTLSCEEPAL